LSRIDQVSLGLLKIGHSASAGNHGGSGLSPGQKTSHP
jgi:hypothetical protein